nr:MMPL family transporter [Metabacillus kandeliae]
MITAPNMGELVKDKGQVSVPSGYSSSLANDLLNKMSKEDGPAVALVFNDSKGLTAAEKTEAKKAVETLDKEKSSLGIKTVNSHFLQKDLEDQFVSKDGKTILAALTMKESNESAEKQKTKINEAIKQYHVTHYMTGSGLIDADVVQSSQDGLKKTEYITLIFILVVLVLVFRSIIAPIVPLITVGIAYLSSQAVVAFLVDKFNFPLSTFTQIFMVAVLFGIGTDYCILLLSRFKEELANGLEKTEAIIRTFQTAGRTVLFSGLAVFAGFASIGFATFKLYQSAVAVAVGIAFLLFALFTVVPFFMAVLGNLLFWPVKGNLQHSESRFFKWAGTFSFKRPLVALLIAAVFIVPPLLKYDGSLSFNSLDEIGDKYESVKAFNLISDSFGPGESLPAKVVIQDDQPLNTADRLAVIEKVTSELNKIEGVDKVRSATRPLGDQPKELLVSSQADSLKKGLGEGKEGIETIGDGLSKASGELSSQAPKLKEVNTGIDKLITGTNGLKTGVEQLQGALKKINNGVESGAAGASEIQKQVAEAEKGAKLLAENGNKLLKGYQEAQKGLASLAGGYGQVNAGLGELNDNFSKLQAQAEAASAQDPGMKAMSDSMKQLLGGYQQTEKSMKDLNAAFNKVVPQLDKANNGLAKLAGGQAEFQKGLVKLSGGLGKLADGLDQAAGGQKQVIDKMPELASGAGTIASSQEQLKKGLSPFADQLSSLTDGLDKSAEGLDKISGGIGSATSYLGELANDKNAETSGWHLPKEALSNKDFKEVFNTYMSPDHKVTTMDIVLKVNPYSNEALDKMNDVEASVHRAVKGTSLENAVFGVSGVTSTYADLKSISDGDYSRTVFYMLLAIFIILAVLLRSFVMPVYIVASLFITYYASAAILEFIFVDILHYAGVNWAVPFFGFVILMALGVDYSIFLMDRFNEYRDMDVRSAMILAMKNMGTVILSAVIILAGTFAAMLPSGVLSLLQIATLILTGLVIYCFLMLPFFIPVMARTFDKANWWPFMKKAE